MQNTESQSSSQPRSTKATREPELIFYPKGTANPNPASPRNSEQGSNASHGRSTPFVNRRFLGSQQKNRVFNPGTQQSSQNHPQMIIEDQSFSSETGGNAIFWGTNINVKEVENKFEKFLREFQVVSEGMEVEGLNFNTVRFYMDKLNQIRETEQYNMLINADHLFQYDKYLYFQLINFPGEMIKIFDQVANKIYAELARRPEDGMIPSSQGSFLPNVIQVGIISLKQSTRMRDLNPKDINHLVSIKGIVIRCSDIYPEMKDSFFRCSGCGRTEKVEVDCGIVQEPIDCANCKLKFSFELIHNMCVFTDKQFIKLQETPDCVPDGETPQNVTLLVYDDNVDFVKPGDKVEVIGIYRAQGMRVTSNRRMLKSVFRTYIDVVTFNKNQSGKLDTGNEGEEKTEYKEEEKNTFYSIADSPNIYEMLVKSFAPSIWENEDVKKGILCQLFGGKKKDFSEAGKGRFRADINVLLVGDPSTAKSQLLQYVHKIAKRGIYTSGKGSSAVGLTAYVTKDPETKEIILESGALVLSDKGICCIDEFDKMDDNTRTILHEAMEQQTISIAKAGIVCSLNCRTSILTSANPVESRYNPKKSVIENIKLPPTLLSRFDLIYLMLDTANEKHDRRLAQHIVSLYSTELDDAGVGGGGPVPEIDRETLTKYISFARQEIEPVISEAAGEALCKGYVEMRRMGINKSNITATPRQLESLIRLSEALAKMRLSRIVEKSDVDEALRLIKVATMQTATNPITGLIDIDMISSGFSSFSREKTKKICEIIKEILKAGIESFKKHGIHSDVLAKEVRNKMLSAPDADKNEEPFNQNELVAALRQLDSEGVIERVPLGKKHENILLKNLQH